MIVAIVLAAVLLAGATYVLLERVGRRAVVPMALRAVAWSGIGVLLFNVGCPTSERVAAPLVLIDGSLSMQADSAAFGRLVDSARARGEVRFFGDPRPATDASPRGQSRLGPSLQGLAATGRPVEVWTDGELDDGGVVRRDLFGAMAIRLFPRADTPAVALTAVRARPRVAVRDSLVIQADLRLFGPWPGDSISVDVRSGDRVLASRAVPPGPDGRRRVDLVIPAARMGPGVHLLDVVLAGPGLPVRTTQRVLHVTVVPTPGVVMVADPADWDARFFYRAVRDIADVPVQGFVRMTGDEWRSVESLEPVTATAVQRAARAADLVVLKGRAGDEWVGPAARAVVRWPSGEGGSALLGGDWYVSAGGDSPLAAALAGLALDSFPPVSFISPLEVSDDEWVGLTAQEGRRGAVRPIVVGSERNGRRQVRVGAVGLWRWAFPGGAAEQGYRAWVAGMTTWLLGGADSAAGVAVPVANVVANGHPMVFRWRGADAPRPVAIDLDAGGGAESDTLVFDGSGLARLWLPPGGYRYTVDGSATGVFAVEVYSEEWLARPTTLEARESARVAVAGRTSAREALWLFGLVVLALAGEWVMRRRLGLR